MRIVRFLDQEKRIRHGDDRGDGRAVPLVDPQGVLGPRTAASRREIFRGKRAVVADDDGNMRELIATTLTKVGCECRVCVDGAETMQAIETEPVDLVVSDIVMPHRNGYEIFAAARERYADLPVVLVTGFGYDPSHSLVRASEEGLAAVLYKPFTPTELLDELDKAIRVSTSIPALALNHCGEPRAIERLVAPIVPTAIIGIGRNYSAGGNGSTDPLTDEQLEVFMKPATSVVGPGEPILLPSFGGVDPLVEPEGELAIVIGATTRDIPADEVDQVILGLTCANDLTARHWQTRTGAPRWMRGKGFDSFCPLGPAIVTEMPALEDLPIRTIVNGHVVRHGTTKSMLRSVPELISLLSRHMTLEAGTVVLTGAPPTTSADRLPPLQPGDEVAVDIEGIGRLVNHVEAP